MNVMHLRDDLAFSVLLYILCLNFLSPHLEMWVSHRCIRVSNQSGERRRVLEVLLNGLDSSVHELDFPFT